MGNSDSDSGNWLVTYSDLVTLLLVFFVLLYTLTPGIDKSTFNDFISYFQTSEGVLDQSAAISRQSSSNDQLRKEWEEIKKYLEEHGLDSQVDIKRIPEGIKVTLSDSLTFNSGSARLLSEAQLVLNEIAQTLTADIKGVKVQGHTDNVPISKNTNYRSNWHLGAARAVSVVLFMRNKTELDSGKFEASSFGEYRPVASNATKKGRRENRRIEMYIQYKKKPELSTNDSLITKQMNRIPDEPSQDISEK